MSFDCLDHSGYNSEKGFMGYGGGVSLAGQKGRRLGQINDTSMPDSITVTSHQF